jgi:hypothetical protein
VIHESGVPVDGPRNTAGFELDHFTHQGIGMNDNKLAVSAKANIKVSLGTSEYGSLQPTVEVTIAPGTHWRYLHAALQVVAAKINLATPPAGRWVVVVPVPACDNAGRVLLELYSGTEHEARGAMALLEELFG